MARRRKKSTSSECLTKSVLICFVFQKRKQKRATKETHHRHLARHLIPHTERRPGATVRKHRKTQGCTMLHHAAPCCTCIRVHSFLFLCFIILILFVLMLFLMFFLGPGCIPQVLTSWWRCSPSLGHVLTSSTSGTQFAVHVRPGESLRITLRWKFLYLIVVFLFKKCRNNTE